MYEYKAYGIRVVDGDTLHLAVDLGCDVTIRMTVRLAGINTPELPTPEGVAAKEFVENWMYRRPGDALLLETLKDKREKYGRYLGILRLELGGESLNDALIAAGHAEAYP